MRDNRLIGDCFGKNLLAMTSVREKTFLDIYKLRSASRLTPTDWLFFIQAWFWLLIFDLGLRTRPFPDMQAFAAWLAKRPALPPEQTENLICSTVIDKNAKYNDISHEINHDISATNVFQSVLKLF